MMSFDEILALLAVVGGVGLLLTVIIFFGVRAGRKAKAEGRVGEWDGSHHDYTYTDHS